MNDRFAMVAGCPLLTQRRLNCCITAALLEPDLPIGAWYSFEIATGIVALDVTEAAGEAK